jgi:hypothetical protein
MEEDGKALVPARFVYRVQAFVVRIKEAVDGVKFQCPGAEGELPFEFSLGIGVKIQIQVRYRYKLGMKDIDLAGAFDRHDTGRERRIFRDQDPSEDPFALDNVTIVPG